MKDEIDAIKEGLKLMPSGWWDFFKKSYVFCFLYGRLFAVVSAFSALIMMLLKALGVPLDICVLVMKILITVGQIIPAASYIAMINNEPNCEGSTDICFSGWIITSLWVWLL